MYKEKRDRDSDRDRDRDRDGERKKQLTATSNLRVGDQNRIEQGSSPPTSPSNNVPAGVVRREYHVHCLVKYDHVIL